MGKGNRISDFGPFDRLRAAFRISDWAAKSKSAIRNPQSAIRLIGLLAVLGTVLALAAVPALGSTEQSMTREFVITAEQFSYTPNIIRVNKGDRVKITLETTDTMHGLYLEGFGVDLKSWKSKRDAAEFVADKTGKFRFRCSVTCGPMHPFMIGELIVERNYTYQVSVILALLTTAGSLAYVWIRKEGS